MAVEPVGVDAAKILDARERHVDKAVEKLVHPCPAERDHHAHLIALSKLEVRDTLFCLGFYSFLSRYKTQVGRCGVKEFLIREGFANTHADHDLGELGSLHHRLVSEFLEELGGDLFHVDFLKPRYILTHYSASPHFRQTRIFFSPSILYPILVGPHFLQTIMTLEILRGASISAIPP